MPPVKGLYVHLPKLLQRQAVDLLMLGFVMGYRHKSPIPVLQIKAGIEKFMADMGLSEDDYPFETARVTFYRMLGEYYEFNNFDKKVCNDKSNKRRNQGTVL